MLHTKAWVVTEKEKPRILNIRRQKGRKRAPSTALCSPRGKQVPTKFKNSPRQSEAQRWDASIRTREGRGDRRRGFGVKGGGGLMASQRVPTATLVSLRRHRITHQAHSKGRRKERPITEKKENVREKENLTSLETKKKFMEPGTSINPAGYNTLSGSRHIGRPSSTRGGETLRKSQEKEGLLFSHRPQLKGGKRGLRHHGKLHVPRRQK